MSIETSDLAKFYPLDKLRPENLEQLAREAQVEEVARDQVLFRAGDTPVARAIEDRAGARLHIAGTLRAETWQGRTTACFTIIDAAPC